MSMLYALGGDLTTCGANRTAGHGSIARMLRVARMPVVTQMLRVSTLLGIALSMLALVGAAWGEEPSKPVNFAREVLPVLSNKCFVCHGPDTTETELRLDSRAEATKDLGGYRALDPDDLEQSEILTRIHSEDAPMPPEDAEKQLEPHERELLARWIRQGGAYAQHWAFVAPSKSDPPLPPSATPGGVVDAFVQQALLEAGVDFAPEADRATLARRASLTLTGLLPQPNVLQEFLTDPRPDAYERYVDRLLKDPAFGEHQARYWLDAVRYGDTHGLHLDNRRGIYPYRDWVVYALNRNVPIDQFITWQLAGDLLPDPTLEQLVATGFVRMNPTTSEGGAIPAEFQAKNNFDRTETLGTVLLGMTLNCARCHTHKYDPIPQEEYYRLLAFFNSTAESSMDGNAYEYAPVVQAPSDQAGWLKWSQWEHDARAVLARAPQASGDTAGDAEPPSASGNSPVALKQRLESLRDASSGDAAAGNADNDVRQTATELLDQYDALQAEFTTTLVAKDLPTPRTTQILKRGEYDQATGDPLDPGILSVLGAFPSDAPHNRLGLAQWLTAREHPLVARVLINRLWQQTFGHGLVRTPEDFGLQGEHPTHPELLDWLAVEFQESGWDMKHMLRMMVTSRTFRQQSRWRTDLDDPENRLFARGPRYRLDAEVLRDVALQTSRLLDPYMGGEGVKPYQPAGMWLAMAHPASNTKQYVRDHGRRLYRRSLYVYWKRTSPHPMMTLFDAPDRETSCVRRSRTNTALQSLGLFNETQRVEMGRGLAERLLREADTDAQRLDRLFTLLVCREPSEAERKACQELLETMLARYNSSPGDADVLLSQGDAERDPSLSAAEHAAWTQVAMTVLASDLGLMLY
jgi:hypothetical protein